MRFICPNQGCFFRFIILSGFLFFSTVAAQDQIRYTGEMTYLPAGSDIAALGDAGVVLPRRAVAALWNPAVSSLLTNYEFSAEVADLYHGLSRQACFASHLPMQGGAGASIVYSPFFSGDIPVFDSLEGTPQERIMNSQLRSDGEPVGYFQNNQHFLVLSWGKLFSFLLPRAPGSGMPLPLEIATGINFKGFWQTMNPDDKKRIGMGVSLDAGLIGRVGLDYDLQKKETTRQLLIGFSFRDIIPSDIVWISSTYDYREPFRYSQYYGISYVDRSGDLAGNWTIALALEKQYEVFYHGGIEAQFWNTISFRAGFSGKTPTLGAGIHYKRYFMDYAFRFDEIDFSYLRLTLGISL